LPEFEHATKKTPHPLETKLAAGKYKWCGCGRTKDVPWCDGRCKGGKPVRFELKKKSEARICTCGLTKTPPYCDGSHVACARPAGKKKRKKGGKGKSTR